MTGLDTNVILRLLLNDDPTQKQQAEKALAEAKLGNAPALVVLAVVLEMEWVLRSSARLHKTRVIDVFRLLMETYEIQVESEKVLEQALHTYKNSSADFAECLFLAQYQGMGCSHMLTFDKKAARMDGVSLISGSE